MTMKLAAWAREKGITYKTAWRMYKLGQIPLWQVNSHGYVAESSAETLNACGELVRPVYQQAHLNEAGRQALSKTGHKRP